jgi:hypothetical protein
LELEIILREKKGERIKRVSSSKFKVSSAALKSGLVLGTWNLELY